MKSIEKQMKLINRLQILTVVLFISIFVMDKFNKIKEIIIFEQVVMVSAIILSIYMVFKISNMGKRIISGMKIIADFSMTIAGFDLTKDLNEELIIEESELGDLARSVLPTWPATASTRAPASTPSPRIIPRRSRRATAFTRSSSKWPRRKGGMSL